MGDRYDNHPEPLRTALRHSASVLHKVLATAPDGRRFLACSAPMPEIVCAELTVEGDSDGRARADDRLERDLIAVLAAGLATGVGGLILRHICPGQPDRLYGWNCLRSGLHPMAAGEIFDAYCFDPVTGDLIGPEPNVEYLAAPDLGDTATPALD